MNTKKLVMPLAMFSVVSLYVPSSKLIKRNQIKEISIGETVPELGDKYVNPSLDDNQLNNGDEVTEGDLRQTSITPINDHSGLVKANSYSYDYKQGAMGHTVNFTINAIYKVNGYYSNALNHFFLRTL